MNYDKEIPRRSQRGSFIAEVDAPSRSKRYMGVERRRTNRRQAQDRRAAVRFELKDDRRQNPGRRETDKSPKFW